ncbi:MAG: 4-hydroxy-3-methylbut-2-enyl diphosphate reductase [candidate division WOR-3 bacterium]
MKVLAVKPFGFCSGVKRALRLLAEAKRRYKKIYTLGEIIHNRPVVEKLKGEGIFPLKKVRKNLKGVLAIRTHGISSRHLKKIEKYGIRLVDTTCPYVRRVKEIVEMLLADGYRVVVLGDQDHPEVISLMEDLGERGFLFSTNPSQKRDLTFLGKWDKVGIVCQTTLAKEFMDSALSEIVKNDFSEIRVFNTICREVFWRQKMFKEVMGKVDAGLVAGGKESANTRRLYEIGSLSGKPIFLLEGEDELLPLIERLKELNVESVGFVSGASTPDDFCSWVIKNLKEEGK